MQIDIITKNGNILKAEQSQIITLNSAETEISFDIVIKQGDLQKLYTFKSLIKTENDIQTIKARLQ